MHLTKCNWLKICDRDAILLQLVENFVLLHPLETLYPLIQT